MYIFKKEQEENHKRGPRGCTGKRNFSDFTIMDIIDDTYCNVGATPLLVLGAYHYDA